MKSSWRSAQQQLANKQRAALLAQQQGLSSAAIGETTPKPQPSQEQVEATKALYDKGARVRVFFWPAGYFTSPVTTQKNENFVEAPLTTIASRTVRSTILKSMTDAETAENISAVTGKHLTKDPVPGHLAVQVINPDGTAEYLSIGPRLPIGAQLKSTALTAYPTIMSLSIEEDISGFDTRKHAEPLDITFVDPKILKETIADFKKNPENYALLGGKVGPKGVSCASIVLDAIIKADYKGVLNYNPSLPPTPEGVFTALQETQKEFVKTETSDANANIKKKL